MIYVGITYWLTAVCFSVYYGYRGFLIEQYYVKHFNAIRHNEAAKLISDIKKNNADENPDIKEYPEWNKPLLTHYIQGCFLYFVSGMAGFVALYVLYNIYTETHLSDISTGTGATIIFLSVFSLIGISGELPYVIKYRKIPGG